MTPQLHSFIKKCLYLKKINFHLLFKLILQRKHLFSAAGFNKKSFCSNSDQFCLYVYLGTNCIYFSLFLSLELLQH